MAAGLQIWDANGVLVSDTTSRWGRFLGSFTIPKPTGNASGSITDAGLSTGEPFFYAYGTQGDWTLMPNIYPNGNTIQWSYNFDQIGGVAVSLVGRLQAVIVHYGVR